jgi:hypothetical protein
MCWETLKCKRHGVLFLGFPWTLQVLGIWGGLCHTVWPIHQILIAWKLTLQRIENHRIRRQEYQTLFWISYLQYQAAKSLIYLYPNFPSFNWDNAFLIGSYENEIWLMHRKQSAQIPKTMCLTQMAGYCYYEYIMHSAQELGLLSPTAWLTSCVNLVEFFSFVPEFFFTTCKMDLSILPILTELLWRLNELIHITDLEQSLAYTNSVGSFVCFRWNWSLNWRSHAC